MEDFHMRLSGSIVTLFALVAAGAFGLLGYRQVQLTDQLKQISETVSQQQEEISSMEQNLAQMGDVISSLPPRVDQLEASQSSQFVDLQAETPVESPIPLRNPSANGLLWLLGFGVLAALGWRLATSRGGVPAAVSPLVHMDSTATEVPAPDTVAAAVGDVQTQTASEISDLENTMKDDQAEAIDQAEVVDPAEDHLIKPTSEAETGPSIEAPEEDVADTSEVIEPGKKRRSAKNS